MFMFYMYCWCCFWSGVHSFTIYVIHVLPVLLLIKRSLFHCIWITCIVAVVFDQVFTVSLFVLHVLLLLFLIRCSQFHCLYYMYCGYCFWSGVHSFIVCITCIVAVVFDQAFTVSLFVVHVLLLLFLIKRSQFHCSYYVLWLLFLIRCSQFHCLYYVYCGCCFWSSVHSFIVCITCIFGVVFCSGVLPVGVGWGWAG